METLIWMRTAGGGLMSALRCLRAEANVNRDNRRELEGWLLAKLRLFTAVLVAAS